MDDIFNTTHEKNKIKNKITKKIIKFVFINISILVILYSIIKINILFQNVYDKKIDKFNCNCDCWDGKFKGKYLYDTKQYKSVYFNMNQNTFFILFWFMFHIILLINYLNYSFELFLSNSLNILFFIESWFLFYGIYYNWWSTFNYINDEFWSMIITQMFYNITELINGYYIYIKINKKKKITEKYYILLPFSTTLIHIFIPLFSQGINNITNFKGMFQRDLTFLLADLIIFIHISFDYLILLNTIDKKYSKKYIIKKDFIKFIKIFSILLGFYFILDFIEIKSW